MGFCGRHFPLMDDVRVLAYYLESQPRGLIFTARAYSLRDGALQQSVRNGSRKRGWCGLDGCVRIYDFLPPRTPGPDKARIPTLAHEACYLAVLGSNRGDLALLRGQRNKTGGEHCVGEFTHLQALAACIQYVECNVCAAAHSQARYVLYLCDVPAARRGAQNHAHRNSHRQHSEGPVELLFS